MPNLAGCKALLRWFGELLERSVRVRDFSWRCLTFATALAVFAAACGDDSGTTSPDTPAPSGTAPSHTEGAHEEHSDTTTTVTSDGSETDGHQHTHGDATTPAVEPYPSVSVHILEDPSGGSEESISSVESSSMAEMEPAQTIAVEVVGGKPVGGHQRVEVELNSEVAIMVTSDTAEEIHVHGYAILHSVAVGQPLHFSFTADIPGVFEVELEGSGRLLLQLTVS